MNRPILAAGALAAILLAGCVVGPDYVRPSIDTPAAYKEGIGWKPAEPRDAMERGSWWESFGDPDLNALIAELDVSNQTIAAAEAQLRVSAALAEQSRAQRWPSLGGSLSRTESRSSGTTGAAPSSNRSINALSLSASWEADLWGRIRRLAEAGDAATRASAGDLMNARLSARGSLAQNFFQLRALDTQKKLLDETAAGYARTLELTRNRYAVGVASRADIAQAEAQLQSTLAALPPPVPAVGVPADLLERRPDIAAAERRVEAANAQIGVARAAFFPTATLGAAYGYQAASSSIWFTQPSLFWSVGPALAFTLFDGGRREAVSAQAMAAYDQAVAAYRATVLQAFAEVEDNVAALRILESEAAVQAEAVKAAQQSAEIAVNQYRAGIATYLQVVTAQNAALQAQITALGIRSRRIAASVQLVKALGGGWHSQ